MQYYGSTVIGIGGTPRLDLASTIVTMLLALIILAGCNPQSSTQQPKPPIPHLLDPLTADEYTQTVALLRAADHINDASRFPSIDLLDPTKASVLAWQPGDDFARTAFAVVKQGPQTFEAVVDLSNASVTSWTEIRGVQPSLLLSEILSVAEILGKNDQFVAALAARGLLYR